MSKEKRVVVCVALDSAVAERIEKLRRAFPKKIPTRSDILKVLIMNGLTDVERGKSSPSVPSARDKKDSRKQPRNLNESKELKTYTNVPDAMLE